MLIGRWWNGKWGYLARRDICLHRTSTGWEVTAREGNSEKGRTRTWTLPDEASARNLVADLTRKDPRWPLNDGWRDLPIE